MDAGAGDPAYQVRDPRLRFVSVDLCVGQDDWDYSAIDVSADLCALPFAAGVFDAVLCTQTLEHVSEPEAVLKELRRCLKPGGKLFLTAPQEWYLHQPPHDYFRYTKYGLAHLLEKAGFKVISTEPHGGYFLLMSHRIALFPRFFFPPVKNPLLRLLRKPFKELVVFIFTRLLPPVFVRMDRFDRDRYATAGYSVTAVATTPRTGATSI